MDRLEEQTDIAREEQLPPCTDDGTRLVPVHHGDSCLGSLEPSLLMIEKCKRHLPVVASKHFYLPSVLVYFTSHYVVVCLSGVTSVGERGEG